MLEPKAKAVGPTFSALRPEFPCNICGGADKHYRLGGEIICYRIQAKEEFPCKNCGGHSRHWSPCEGAIVEASKKRACLEVGERIKLAYERIGKSIH